jgi:transcriptional regulator with XRE-family HTH domain
MGERQAPVFAELLKRVRSEAGLTQEELAEAATIGVRTVSDLERGVSVTARKETARLLADALGLTGATRATFEAAARGRTWLGLTEGRAHGLPAPLTSFLGAPSASLRGSPGTPKLEQTPKGATSMAVAPLTFLTAEAEHGTVPRLAGP